MKLNSRSVKSQSNNCLVIELKEQSFNKKWYATKKIAIKKIKIIFNVKIK